MPFKPENIYDSVEKIWSCPVEADHFAPDLSIGEIIYNEMKRHPEQIAQISATENTVLTREELLSNAMRISSYLRKLGLRQTDIVGIIARNTTHLPAVTYACFFNGIAFHPIFTHNGEAEIEFQFNNSKPKLIFCDGALYDKVRGATKNLAVKFVTMCDHPADSTDTTTIQDVLKTPIENNFRPAKLEQGNNQILMILGSSGTTAIPKLVPVTNSRKMLNALLMLTTSDVQYAVSPVFWTSGVRAFITSAVFSTKLIINDNEIFNPVLAIRIIEKYKVTWAQFGPAYLAQMINSPEFEGSSMESMRYIMYCGERMALEVGKSLRQRVRQNVLLNSYGMTELGTWCTVNWHYDEKPESVGRLTSGFKLKIINEQNESLGPNETGEICIHSGQYWPGYYGNMEATCLVRDKDNWFHSGDLGYMDDDGFLYIVDRKKDLLRYQYKNYYPKEVEKIIFQMPEVIDVCVFGIWNKYNGDEAAAAVVKKPESQLKPEDVVEYVKQNAAKIRHLHSGCIIVDDLKRSPNGKTNRRLTKEYFMELKGLVEEK